MAVKNNNVIVLMTEIKTMTGDIFLPEEAPWNTKFAILILNVLFKIFHFQGENT